MCCIGRNSLLTPSPSLFKGGRSVSFQTRRNWRYWQQLRIVSDAQVLHRIGILFWRGSFYPNGVMLIGDGPGQMPTSWVPPFLSTETRQRKLAVTWKNTLYGDQIELSSEYSPHWIWKSRPFGDWHLVLRPDSARKKTRAFLQFLPRMYVNWGRLVRNGNFLKTPWMMWFSAFSSTGTGSFEHGRGCWREYKPRSDGTYNMPEQLFVGL